VNNYKLGPTLLSAALLLSLAGCAEGDAPISSDQPQAPANPSGEDTASMLSGGPLMIADQGYFYVGGQYTDIPTELNLEPAAPEGTRTNTAPTRYYGQMYVEYQIPAGAPQDLPIVLVHGGSRTGADYLMTPDGRPGWRDFFLRRGFPIYIVDQVARGRSPYVDNIYGESRYQTYDFVMQRFAASENYELWPQAERHTRWPGNAEPGDPSFDNYYAGGIGSMQDREMQNQMNIDALAALLDRIGPAIVVVHSQSGAYGWPLVQARPDLVKALVALEPSGPPVHGVSFHGSPEWFTVEGGWKPWGLTITPLEYAPALSGPEELQFAQEDEAESPEHIRCWLQGETVRGLTGFDNSPVLVVESEASFYAPYNYCTVKYLQQAGVETDYIRAQDEGLPGGGHMFMAELDSDNVAQLVHDWLSETVAELR
jgi:pimeloyl-ACP methyl ester carboxylesterase